MIWSDRSRVRCRSCLRRVDLYLSFQRQKWRCFCQFVNCYYSFPSFPLFSPPAVTSHGAPVAQVVPPRLRLPGHRHSSPCHIHRQATNLGQISCIRFFATSKTWQKNARTWPTHTPFGSAPREESIAGVFAVLQGKRFFGPPAGALCLDYFSFKSLLRRHWVISNLYPTPYPILDPRTSRIPPQSSTLVLATDDGGQWCLVPFS